MTAEPIKLSTENSSPEIEAIASESPDLPVLPDLEALGTTTVKSETSTDQGREMDRLFTGESEELTNDFWAEKELNIPSQRIVKKEELRSPVVSTSQDEFPTYPGNPDDSSNQKQILESEILALQNQKAQLLETQLNLVQSEIERIIKDNIRGLEQRKQTLELDIERLEKRQAKIQQEMRTTFAGASQELAIRVQGFKDYLVGSLQDLVAAADQLELTNSDPWNVTATKATSPQVETVTVSSTMGFSEQKFIEQRRQIQRLLEQYRSRPDYYGPPWQLRRTFEPIHAERVQDWFFTQGGRGVIRTLGSRLQNILVSSSVISILSSLYGNKSRALILANSPERLGEWRRGLQDCLGISRTDFGPERGIVLFESPEALIQKAERLVEEHLQPLVLIDDTQEQVDLALLQFPLWLAFAPDAQQPSSGYFY